MLDARAAAPLCGRRSRVHGVNVTTSPFEKFENEAQGPPTSLYHVWKYQVVPALICPGGGLSATERVAIPGPSAPVPVPVA